MRDLPARRRHEIVAEVEEHIAESLAEIPDPTDADIRNVLDRVGEPEDIAAEARERFGASPARRRWTDVAAVILLLLGGFTVVGWFVGVVFLWISDVWNVRDKLVGTLIVPGGLAATLAVAFVLPSGGTSCPVGSPLAACTDTPSPLGPFEIVLVTLFVTAPILTSIYLGVRLRRRSAPR